MKYIIQSSNNTSTLSKLSKAIHLDLFDLIIAELSISELQNLQTDADITNLTEDLPFYAVQNYQNNPPNGLKQLVRTDYYSYTKTGAGVDVYVIDTGISFTHNEFSKRNGVIRVFPLSDYREFFEDMSSDDTMFALDNNGHGTHMASIIGGRNYGVAKEVSLFSCKAFDENQKGSTASVLLALHGAYKHHVDKPVETDPFYRPSVVNMSFASRIYGDDYVNSAVQTMIDSGMICVAAAGNYGIEIGEFGSDNLPKISPASIGDVITVGSHDADYSISTSMRLNENGERTATPVGTLGSNTGKVDIFAPGTQIIGAWIGSNKTYNNETRLLSGTSASAAFVSGLLALRLSDAEYGTITSEFDQESLKQFLIDTSVNNRAYSVFQQGDLRFINPEGPLLRIYEDTQLELQLQATNKDVGSNPIRFSIPIFSEQENLSNKGFGLSPSGLLEGRANIISPTDSDYVPISSLSIDEQEMYNPDIAGFVDVTFDVRIEDTISDLLTAYDSVDRSFSIRIFRRNEENTWGNIDKININQLLPYSEFVIPSVLDTTPNIFEYDTTVHLTNPDNDNNTFSLLWGSLPNGLVLDSNTGIISGKLLPNCGELESTFEFSIRADDGTDSADQIFIITVRRNISDNSAPIWDDITSPPYNSQAIVDTIQTRVIDFSLSASDPDGDQITYSVVPINDAVPSEYGYQDPGFVIGTDKMVVWGLPDGLYLKPNGTIWGVVQPSAYPNPLEGSETEVEYYFSVLASDGIDGSIRTFLIKIGELASEFDVSPISAIIWNTPEGSLGEMDETEVSLFRVEAEEFENDVLLYDLFSGTLPPGLTLQENGNISGRAEYINSDTVFEFIIRARSQIDPSKTSNRSFSITVKNIYTEKICFAYLPLLGDNKKEFDDFLTDNEFFIQIISSEFIYEENDENFGRNNDLRVYLYSGFNASPQEFWNAIREEVSGNGYDQTRLNTPGSQTYYDKIEAVVGPMNVLEQEQFGLIYVPIYDPNFRAGGFTEDGDKENITYPHIDLSKAGWPINIYPKSILNMRRDLQTDTNFTQQPERVPIWMKEYVSIIPLFYIKKAYIPAMENIINLTPEIKNRFLGKKIKFDRILFEEWEEVSKPRQRWFRFPKSSLRGFV